jgi:chemotaxis protein methyltransferase CheR
VPGPSGDRYAVNDKLKQLILVRQFNLTNFPYTISGSMDFVFCRNVMIYFDRPTRAEIIKEFSRIVRPGGYLFVGHSESLSGMADNFILVKPSVYRRV